MEFSNGSLVLSNIYERLLRYDPIGERFVPELAISYESSKDGLTWTFHLRRNVYFHDGVRLDADAVKFSIERSMRLRQGASYIWNPIDEIKTIDKYRVQFFLKYPAAMDLAVSCAYGAFIMSPKAVTSHLPNWLSDGNEAGTGPYTLHSFKTGDEVVLSAFRNYWGGWKPNQFKQVIIKRISSSSKRRELLENGTVDISVYLSTEDNEILKNNDKIVKSFDGTYANAILLFNTAKAPLNDKMYRKAIRYAFPTDQIWSVLGHSSIKPSKGLIPSGIWGHHSNAAAYTYNMEKAQQLLSQSKHSDRDHTLVLTYFAENNFQKRIAEMYRDSLKKIGIRLKLQGMSWESQEQLAKHIKPENRQDILMMIWWPDLISPYSWLYNLYHSQSSIGFNYTYLQSPTLDQLIDRMYRFQATNRKEAITLVKRAQKMIRDEAVSIPVYDLKATWVYQNSLKGFRFNPAYQDVIFFYETYRN